MNSHTPDNLSEEDRRLRETLQDWDVEANPPPDLRRGVWQRIEDRSSPRTNLLDWLEPFTGQLHRPAVGTAVAALVLAVAIFGGVIHSQIARKHTMTQLGERYAATIDPLARTHTGHDALRR